MSLIERLKQGSELKSTVNRQVVPKICDTFSKKVGSNRAIAKILKNLIRVASSRTGS